MTSCRCCAPRSRWPGWLSTPAGNLMTWPSRVAWRPRLRRALREQNADVLEASEPVAVVAAVAAAAGAGGPGGIGAGGGGGLWEDRGRAAGGTAELGRRAAGQSASVTASARPAANAVKASVTSCPL